MAEVKDEIAKHEALFMSIREWRNEISAKQEIRRKRQIVRESVLLGNTKNGGLENNIKQTRIKLWQK